jgi:hypothetical protein
VAAPVKKPRKRKPTYPEELWHTIESLYRTGQFTSIANLHKHCSATFPKYPGVDAIKQRFAKHNIRRGDKLAPLIAEEIEKRTVDMFADLGMPKERVMNIIIDGLSCADGVKEKLIAMVREAIANHEAPVTETTVHVIEILFSRIGFAHGFVKTYLEWTGIAAPKKIDHSNKGEPFAAPSYTSLPDDDIERKLKERLERLTRLKGVPASAAADKA